LEQRADATAVAPHESLTRPVLIGGVGVLVEILIIATEQAAGSDIGAASHLDSQFDP
jgi:hypothetical protein